MKKIATIALLASALLAASPALADNYFEAVPTGWKMQNYVPNNLITYYTGTACYAGQISFGPNATNEDKNRFYSLVLTAQTTGKKIGVFYETVSGSCQISSFFPVL
ncbi:hypothetical protein ASD79_21520 [Caulobacter sp. Root655]|uniref:hypothetical protein n=1 Tax=Caulobacter sp. Root655 TaxID=1736578 RepID=UPI0006FF9D41|nr:hypothetical protein [Caulobacter sp. Root655]KRA63874.1 hypothetical protein ASD79_21520 [Caulobacter sp. Root655]